MVAMVSLGVFGQASDGTSYFDTVDLLLVMILCTVAIIAVLMMSRKHVDDHSHRSELKEQNVESNEVEHGDSFRGTVLRAQGGSQYRLDEESRRTKSSAFTQRGSLWSRRASWHLPSAPRLNDSFSVGKYASPGFQHMREICLRFEIDLKTGFLPGDDPLQRLPSSRYHIWEDLADDLPKLLGARLGQVRAPLDKLPVLSIDRLITTVELKRAHLLLCLFAHSYIWGGRSPMDTLPEGVAIPLWQISEKLGIPPVLGHPSIVLYNWRRLDSEAEICMENLATLNNFFDGRDESWFYLITVEVEAKGAPGILPLMLAMDAIGRYNEEVKEIPSLCDINRIMERRKMSTLGGALESVCERTKSAPPNRMQRVPGRPLAHLDHDDNDDFALDDSTNRYYHPGHDYFEDTQVYSYMYEEDMPQDEPLVGELNIMRVIQYVTLQLRIVATAIKDMDDSLNCMNEGCLPFVFYHRVRPFLSGWKSNPTLPNGVLYRGVDELRHQFYGGSAAQSAMIPFLDIGLGVQHNSSSSKGFLLAMRDYMLRPHREFLEYWQTVACLKEFIDDVMKLTGVTADSMKGDTEKKGSQRSAMDDAVDAVKALVSTYDLCLLNLTSFRSTHISLVGRYIIQQQEKQVSKSEWENTTGGKGTGGTDLMNFLKPIRNDCRRE